MNITTETTQDTARRIGAEMMADPHTSITDLSEAGWNLEMNMGGRIYFRHTPTQGVLTVPFWATQMCSEAKKESAEDVKRAIREALGMFGRPARLLRGSQCVP